MSKVFAVPLRWTVTAAIALSGFAWSTSHAATTTLESAEDMQVGQAIEEQYEHWKGTRHRLGGTSEAGIDCSAFIQNLFAQHFGIDLPRSSREQMVLGSSVPLERLRIGDLMFFRSGPTRRHVAVYIGKGRFLHVSAREGVAISSMNEAYWKHRFLLARRLM